MRRCERPKCLSVNTVMWSESDNSAVASFRSLMESHRTPSCEQPMRVDELPGIRFSSFDQTDTVPRRPQCLVKVLPACMVIWRGRPPRWLTLNLRLDLTDKCRGRITGAVTSKFLLMRATNA